MNRDDGLAFSVTAEPSLADVAIIEEALIAYNVAKARPYDRRPLHVFLRDADGRTIGGLTGETNWDWLYVDCFWLPDDLRGEGWGAKLLDAAENAARARGCRHVRLFSYSFQAPAFYEKRGYKAFGVLEILSARRKAGLAVQGSMIERAEAPPYTRSLGLATDPSVARLTNASSRMCERAGRPSPARRRCADRSHRSSPEPRHWSSLPGKT